MAYRFTGDKTWPERVEYTIYVYILPAFACVAGITFLGLVLWACWLLREARM